MKMRNFFMAALALCLGNTLWAQTGEIRITDGSTRTIVEGESTSVSLLVLGKGTVNVSGGFLFAGAGTATEHSQLGLQGNSAAGAGTGHLIVSGGTFVSPYLQLWSKHAINDSSDISSLSVTGGTALFADLRIAAGRTYVPTFSFTGGTVAIGQFGVNGSNNGLSNPTSFTAVRVLTNSGANFEIYDTSQFASITAENLETTLENAKYGTMTVAGNLVLESGSLTFDVSYDALTSQFLQDSLLVRKHTANDVAQNPALGAGGNLTLGGDLILDFTGIEEMLEDGIWETTFTLATAENTMTGSFANILVENLPYGFDYSVALENNRLAVTVSADHNVLPEPATWMLLLVGGGMLWYGRKPKNKK
ncbi:MAG: PEP-CTERM sorting domain-containing protein [Planctomycetia bacterium]|nr:PEP-CTERM sorting domain-containing protein [Planctomycetia bacterium]